MSISRCNKSGRAQPNLVRGGQVSKVTPPPKLLKVIFWQHFYSQQCNLLQTIFVATRAGLYTLLYPQIADSIYFLNSYFLKQRMAFFFSYLSRGLKPLPKVLAYFDAFGIFKSHYNLEKLISKKYMQKYIKVYNPALVATQAILAIS